MRWSPESYLALEVHDLHTGLALYFGISTFGIPVIGVEWLNLLAFAAPPQALSALLFWLVVRKDSDATIFAVLCPSDMWRQDVSFDAVAERSLVRVL